MNFGCYFLQSCLLGLNNFQVFAVMPEDILHQGCNDLAGMHTLGLNLHLDYSSKGNWLVSHLSSESKAVLSNLVKLCGVPCHDVKTKVHAVADAKLYITL